MVAAGVLSAAIGAGASIGSSILGPTLSAIFNSGSSAKAAKKSYQYQSLLNHEQYRLQRLLNQNAYQDTTYSMREAGINPMLAISNGASSGSVGLGSVSQNAPQIDLDLQGAVGSALAYKNDLKRLDNETKTTNETVEKLKADSKLSNEQAQALKISNEYAPRVQEAQIKALEAQEYNNIAQGNSALSNANQDKLRTPSVIKSNSAKATAVELDAKTNSERIPVSIDIWNKIKHSKPAQNIKNSYNYMQNHSAKDVYESEIKYLINRYGKRP